MFDDLNTKIENFYEMNEVESDWLLKELNYRINRQPDQFKQFMDELGYGHETNRPIYYEGLIFSNPNIWNNYIFEELNILISNAEEGDKEAIYELSSIYWLIDIPKMNDDFYKKTKSYLFSKLNSKNAQIRRLSLAGIFDIQHHLNAKPNQDEIPYLQNCLKDKNIKNKVYAYSDLKDANLIPKGFKFSILDKIRIKLKGYSKLIE